MNSAYKVGSLVKINGRMVWARGEIGLIVGIGLGICTVLVSGQCRNYLPSHLKVTADKSAK